MLKIDAARAKRAAECAALTGTRALLIMQQDQIVLEQYWHGAAPDVLLRLASGTKSFCAGVLAGRLS